MELGVRATDVLNPTSVKLVNPSKPGPHNNAGPAPTLMAKEW